MKRGPGRSTPLVLSIVSSRFRAESAPAAVAVAALFAASLWAGGARAATPVFISPQSAFPSGQFERPLLEAKTVETRRQRWLKVRAVGGKVGWTPEDWLVTSRNQAAFGAFAPRWPLGPSEAVVARDSLPLRAAPNPSAEVLATLPAGSPVQRLAESTLRWGRAIAKSLGHAWKDQRPFVWWPMVEGLESKPAASAALPRLSTAELFRRKIYDVAAHPASPERQLVSAQGVFRSVDGATWEKLAQFKDANYPVAFSRSGAAFVGPYASFDGGETFQQFVKWDALVEALKTAYDVDPERIKVLETQPLDETGSRVRLSLEIGVGQVAVATSDDFGTTWSARKPKR